MAIAGLESRWRTFTKTTAPFDLGSAVVTGGGLAVSAARFFATHEFVWGWMMAGLAVAAVTFQGLKARASFLEQLRKESVHDLLGCLHTLETVLLGPALDPAQRAAAGLRLTILIPDGRGSLQQVCEYVGDQRSSGRTRGRRVPENAGVAGHAFQHARLNPARPALFWGSRATNDYEAFLRQMVEDYSFSLDGARLLNPSTMSWVAIAITDDGVVHGVLYADAKRADFFTEGRREDILHATAGIAFFVGRRYP